MSWYKAYISTSGVFTGTIPFYDFPPEFEILSWNAPYNTYFANYVAAGYAAKDYSGLGIDISLLPKPVTLITLQNKDKTQYIRMVADVSEWRWESSTDGSTWTTLAGTYGVDYNRVAVPVQREVNGDIYIGILLITPGSGQYSSLQGQLLNADLWESDFGEFDYTEISPEYGPESGPSGYDGGTFDDSSDTIGVPAMPTIGVSSIGFVNVYNPSTGALTQLGEDLFPDFTPTTPYSPTGNTVIDAITDVAEALANIATNIPNMIEMYNNSQLINYIIDCHIIPVTPSIGASQAIKIGYRAMSQMAPKVTSDYVDCDCGSLNIGEYYRNFIDYGPYTQAKLFLPFVGFVPIEPELFQSGVLKVVYRFNVIDGSFMAFVLSTSSKSKLTDTVIGQWGGNACVHVPITGINYSNMVSGIAAGASAVVAEIGKGSLIGTADAALNTAAAAPALQSSNGYNATTSFLSVRTPYLMIERSVSHYSKDYGHEQGYPSEITTDLTKISGYTEADSIHIEGIDATDTELSEIASRLAAGVIL